MKIIKIELNKEIGFIVVWTSVFLNIGFHFNINEIIDINDLILKIKQRITEEINKRVVEETNQIKFNQFKSLERTEI